jgi:hypothetical protein
MEDELHIRSAEAVHLAQALARQTGKTISEVVLDALRQYRPDRAERARLHYWQQLLREDHAGMVAQPEAPIETLYDDTTGLPT